MVQKISAILFLLFLFVIMPAIGMLTNVDYIGFFIAHLSDTRGKLATYTPESVPAAPAQKPMLVSAAIR